MTLSLGTPTTDPTLLSNTNCWEKIVPLDTDKAVYVRSANASGDLQARVITTSGTTISALGSVVTLALAANVNVVRANVVALSTSSFIAVWFYPAIHANQFRIVGVACTVSGTTITNGAITEIVSVNDTVRFSSELKTAKIDTNKAIVVYTDRQNSFNATAVAFTITGTTINSPGSAHVFRSATTTYIDVSSLRDGSKAIASYVDGGHVYGQVLSVSGTTVTSGTALQLTSGTETRITTRSLGMSSTKCFVSLEQTTGSPHGIKVFLLSVSGTTLTNEDNANIGISSSGAIEYGRTRISDTISIYNFSIVDGTTKEQAREVQITGGGTTITAGTTLDLDDPADALNGGVAVVGSDKAVIIYATDQVDVITTTLSNGNGGGAGDNYVLAVSADKQLNDNTFWLTLWKADGNLYVQKWNGSTMTLISEVSLGAATLAAVQARTRIGIPYAVSGQRAYVYGNMLGPAYITGITSHLIQTSTGGVSGTWSDVNIGWNDTDVMGSFHSTPGLFFTGVRNQTGSPPELWRGQESLALISLIPMPTGATVKHGGMHLSIENRIVVGAAENTTGTPRIFMASDPYTSWSNITDDFPITGSVSVLRFV